MGTSTRVFNRKELTMKIKHTYLLSNYECNVALDKICKKETEMGFEFDHFTFDGSEMILFFQPIEEKDEWESSHEEYYDIFIKWNNEEKEIPFLRAINQRNMECVVNCLLKMRKEHFRSNNKFEKYIDYVRVE